MMMMMMMIMMMMTLSRFGAQARDDVAVVEKCIIARVRIIDDQGKTVGIRPVHDK